MCMQRLGKEMLIPLDPKLEITLNKLPIERRDVAT